MKFTYAEQKAIGSAIESGRLVHLCVIKDEKGHAVFIDSKEVKSGKLLRYSDSIRKSPEVDT